MCGQTCVAAQLNGFDRDQLWLTSATQIDASFYQSTLAESFPIMSQKRASEMHIAQWIFSMAGVVY